MKGPEMSTKRDYDGLSHDWDNAPLWGVIFGITKCKRCGKIATEADFPKPTPKPLGTLDYPCPCH